MGAGVELSGVARDVDDARRRSAGLAGTDVQAFAVHGNGNHPCTGRGERQSAACLVLVHLALFHLDDVQLLPREIEERREVVRLEDVGELVGAPDEIVSAVMMQLLGDVTGRTIQIFPWRTAVQLTSKLLSRNLALYGLGGIIAPFIGIKLIDLVVGLIPGF